ncbi:MAG: xylulokinase [Clostridiaceae bacterium]|nr:xylulokinase [Clostridiaceae bacterium]
MARDILIGIDVGTTGVKVLAVTTQGDLAASAIEAYPLYTPQTGWTEQEPADWWQATKLALKRTLAALPADRLLAVGLSGQMHGMVALDAKHQVVRRAILWNDQRTASQCRELTDLAGGPEALLAMTNNQMLTGYTAGKIRWLQQAEPDNFAHTRLILNPKDYLRLCLTGSVLTEVSDASGTGLYDVQNNRWHTGLIRRAGLDPALFPPVVASTEEAGRISEEAAAQTGLPAGLPVSGGGGDAVISTTGLGLVRPGRIGITLGTSGVVAMGLDAFMANPEGKLQVFRGNAPGSFTAMGVTLAAAGSYHWFRQALGQHEREQAGQTGRSAFQLLDEAAGATEPGAAGLIFLPYLTGERCPIHDPAARGGFIGLTGLHEKGHFARAVLEGVAYSLRQVHALIAANSPDRQGEGTVILAGGGAVSPVWRQIFADVFQLPVQTVYGSAEGGSFGAALVAGVTAGVWTSLPEAVRLVRTESETLPDPSRAAVYAALYDRYTRAYGALQPLFA